VSGGLSIAVDEVWKLRDGRTVADTELGAKIIPKGDAELPARVSGRTKAALHALLPWEWKAAWEVAVARRPAADAPRTLGKA
jgi:hypothetical protein